MRLKKLLVHGFKSFADNVEIVFEDGITGVVGPNGCGKSNISDAIKWVLGEQSAKSLRGTKMEDVIFNGTEKRKRLSYCEVTLVFDNTDHALPIDFAEVAVMRRVYRNGEGEYKLNGTACRLRDIVDLFRDTGIGKDGYSMIGQGRIDEILSVKSEDRRQVFEEAAGITKYKARKRDAERRMDNTMQNLNRVDDLLTDLEERVEPLRKQSETAREYLTLRDELKILDLNVFILRSERYEVRLKELAESLETLDSSIKETTLEIEKATAERDACQINLSELEQDAAEKRDIVQALIRDVEAADGEVKVLRERMSSLEKDKNRLEEQLEAAGKGGEGLAARLLELEQRIEERTISAQELAKELEEKESALTLAEKELADAEERAETLKQAIIDSMNRLGDVRSQRARLEAMKNALENQLESMHSDDERNQTGIESLEQQVNQARSHMEDEKARAEELKKQTEEHNTRVQALNDRLHALSDQVTELQNERQSADSRLKLLREMQRDYEGYNNSVKQVLLQARRNPNSGVYGVVADLLSVPERLERAVDMVLGGALQNIVVERDEDAKRMIDYLRSNRFGRATFLPVASVRGRVLSQQERSVLNMPGCIGVASELISIEDRFKGIADSLLGRTVIAEDLNSAIAIQRASHYQLRLVTLEGDVMNPGGSMTGGSVQSQATSLISRSREIAETEKKLADCTEKLSKLREVYRELDEERTTLKKERTELFEESHRQDVLTARAEELYKAAVEEQNSNNQRIEQARNEQTRLETQLQDVTDALETLESQQADAKLSTQERQAEVKRLQDAIYSMRSSLETLRKEALDLRVSDAEQRRDLDAFRTEKERLQDQTNDTEKLLEESKTQLEKCRRDLEACAVDLEGAIQRQAEEKDDLQTARERFNSVDKNRTEEQSRLQQLTSDMDAIRVRMDDLTDKQHRSDVLKTRLEGEYKQIQDRIWEDYELTAVTAEPFRQQDFKLTESEKRIASIRARIRAMGTVNVAAVDEYRQTVERVEEMTRQRDDLLKARDDLDGIIAQLNSQMDRQFRSQFELIGENFNRTFTKLFGGGTAQLQLSDPKDALNCGIDIIAQPPGKKLQMLSLLSGGERALTAIAILFAILDLKPTPFCMLDEIEAALDDANIDTYADYLKDYSKKTQFIVITHRKGTMERCDALYGVVMQEKGVSKTVSVKLNEALHGV